MFREEEFDDDQYDEGEEEYSEEFTNERLYPNLSDSRSDDFPNSLNPMMNGSITQLNDLGFKPILSESMMVNEKVKVQSSPPPIVNDITLKMNNDRCDGEILSGQSTPREMISCKLSDMEIDLKKYPDFIPTHYDLYEDKIFEEMDHRRLSNASSNKDEDYFSNYSKIDWDVNEDEEQIELIYCEEPRRKKKVPNNQFSEFDLGVASCRETLKEWEIEERNNLTLLNNLADFHILNKIISFIYYPNKEDLLRISQTQEKNYDIAQMLKKIISLRLVNKKWKQSIDNPTGVLYHYLIEYATMEKSIALNNLKVEESKFCLFSVPGIAMVGLANILKDASLLPMTFGNLAYEKVEGQYGSTAANTVKVLGAGISLASGTFALFALSGVFYWIPAAAGGFVLDKAIEYGINYSNKVKAENEVIHNVGEKEKKLLQFRKKIRRVTKFDKIEIVDHEKVEQVQQYQDSSLSGYLFSYGGYFQNKHSVYYVMRVSLKFDENNQSQSQTFSYRIKKRYSQFQKLYQQMCSLRKVDKIMYNDEYLAFPEKERLDTILNWRSDEIIGMRTKIFNNILSELVENIEVYKNDEEIMHFLTDSCE